MKRILLILLSVSKWCGAIALVVLIQIQAASATPGLFKFGKKQVKEFGASGSIVMNADGSATIDITITNTSRFRTGDLNVAVPSPDGKISSVWTVDPSRPLKAHFSIPKGRLRKCEICFSVLRSDAPVGPIESVSAVYYFDLSRARSPLFGTIPSIPRDE